ncbi:2-succinyl-5-enolpyruvyl-6-hydroxy-3-cyclohexene-1-carboxylic-acid synthase [Trichothermofontia sp.]
MTGDVGIDDRNTNTVWASVLAETLYRLGLATAVVCPGSRSAPLAIALAAHASIEAIPVLDERSASFFALGLARRSGRPAVLVCTSGTAGANFYPAVIEAHESQVPLLILTADRPPELRQCHAGQTIDQIKLYGSYPNWQAELATPSVARDRLAYLRQTLVYAWERTQWPVAGPVHLNVPLREPLTPIVDPVIADQMQDFEPAVFFAGIHDPVAAPVDPIAPDRPGDPSARFALDPVNPNLTSRRTTVQYWWQCVRATSTQGNRGLIIAGLAQPHDPQAYCQAIAALATRLQWPVLAEGLSPLRNFQSLCPALITTYDWLLRDRQWRTTVYPDIVLQIGELPTSKELRQWLTQGQPQRWIVDASDHNFDPLHGPTQHLRLSVETLSALITAQTTPAAASPPTAYCLAWTAAEHRARTEIDTTLAALADPFEGKVAWLLAQTLPIGTPLFIANSTPVRDVEWFWPPGDRQIHPFFNRGANGIDGTLSTALGIAHRHQPTVLLTGDLALLHDTNGLLLGKKLVGHLTIVLINNNGGGIFESLPIAQFDPPFTEFFATPQQIDFAQFCATYGIEHIRMTDWQQFQDWLNPLPTTGIRLLEVRSDRQADAHWRKQFFARLPHSLPVGQASTCFLGGFTP